MRANSTFCWLPPLNDATAATIRPEDRPSELGTSGTDQTRQAENLAFAQLKRHARDPRRVQTIHRERDRLTSRRWRLLRERRAQRPPKHSLDQRVLALLRRRARADELAVAQDRHDVRQLEHLAQEV